MKARIAVLKIGNVKITSTFDNGNELQKRTEMLREQRDKGESGKTIFYVKKESNV